MALRTLILFFIFISCKAFSQPRLPYGQDSLLVNLHNTKVDSIYTFQVGDSSFFNLRLGKKGKLMEIIYDTAKYEKRILTYKDRRCEIILETDSGKVDGPNLMLTKRGRVAWLGNYYMRNYHGITYVYDRKGRLVSARQYAYGVEFGCKWFFNEDGSLLCRMCL